METMKVVTKGSGVEETTENKGYDELFDKYHWGTVTGDIDDQTDVAALITEMLNTRVPTATAEDDVIMAGATPFAWVKKTLAQLRAKIFSLAGAADGDTYHQASGVLARLAAGAANFKMFMNAAGTLPEWANGFKVKSFERDLSAAGAPTDVAYTGWGFKPSALLLLAIISPGTPCGWSLGFYANEIQSCGGQQYSTIGHSSGNLGMFHEASVTNQACVVKSLDADGFTLTWTKTGSGTAWAYGVIIALR